MLVRRSLPGIPWSCINGSTYHTFVLFRETETTSEKLAKNVQDMTKKIGLDSEKLMDDAEKYFEKAKNYEFTQTPEGNENH